MKWKVIINDKPEGERREIRKSENKVTLKGRRKEGKERLKELRKTVKLRRVTRDNMKKD